MRKYKYTQIENCFHMFPKNINGGGEQGGGGD